MKYLAFTDLEPTPQVLTDAGWVDHMTPCDKMWTSKEEFFNSKEVADVYDGFQASANGYKKFHFVGGFMFEGNIYIAYEAEGVSLVQRLTLGSTLHNGGDYAIVFCLNHKKELLFHVNKGTAYDISAVRKLQKQRGKKIDITFIGVYDAP